MKNNITHTFTAFLKALGAKVTTTSATDYIETHPDYPSMAAYSDALEHWQIENAAFRISAEQLPEMPTPFITFSRRKGGTFSLIRSVGEAFIERLDTELGWVKEKAEEFYADWSGVVLLAEVAEGSGEKDFVNKRSIERLKQLPLPLALVCLGIILLLGVTTALPLAWGTVALLIIQLTGAVIGSLLLVKSIDTHNAFINRLCNSGSKFSCQSILDSDAAKITNWLSWSDMGFIYGVGSLVSLLLVLQNPQQLQTWQSLSLLLSAVGVAFSFYSFYYQGIKAKIWCPLCFGFMAVFWAELGVSYITLTTFNFSPATLLTVSSGYLISIAFLLLYKPTAIAAQKADATQKELSRMKNNPEIFNALLASQKAMPYLPAKGIGVVELGNPNADHTLVVVTNPLCGWCAKMHDRVEKVLAESPNLKCQVVFLTNPDDMDATARIARTIFSLPPTLQHEAISQWFAQNDRNVEKWAAAYTAYPEKEIARVFENEQRLWCNEAEVRQTPTLFFNGKTLPSSVQVEDIIPITRFSKVVENVTN